MRAALHQPLVASRMVMTLALVACASERPSQPRVSEPMVQVTRAPEGVVEKSEPTEVKVGRSDFDELVVEVIAAFNQKQVPVLDRLLDSELGCSSSTPWGFGPACVAWNRSVTSSRAAKALRSSVGCSRVARERRNR